MNLHDLIKQLEPDRPEAEVQKIIKIFNCFVSEKVTNNLPKEAVSKVMSASAMLRNEGIKGVSL